MRKCNLGNKKNKAMKARIRFTDIVSIFTYNQERKGYTCNEDTRDKKMVFAPYELVEIK